MENKPEVRVAQVEDKQQFNRLWELCFEDSLGFRQWLFSNRFYPNYSVCLQEGEAIHSAMQAVPYAVRVRDKVIKGAMLCGVSTHPNQRGRGFMGKIFRYEMNLLREKGFALAVHTPAILPSYFSYGHYPVADANYFECEAVPLDFTQGKAVLVEETRWEELFPLYVSEISNNYSGAIVRTKEEFLRKCQDYAADGGKCAIYENNGVIEGYSFFYETEKSLLAAETVAKEACYYPLVCGLCSFATGKAISVKLPTNLFLHLPFGTVTKKQKGVAGLVNLQTLLQALQMDSPYSIQIRDTVVEENNGVFTLDGKKSEQPPAILISAGHFLQVLMGYATLDELEEHITIFDENGFLDLQKQLPKYHCYIIDEY